ncbi:MAG: ribonuclease HII [Bacteroidetes bacterium]|jgi:ribonuclease HII|nr:ribonuclease HII [Bacteroidota bacterium]
MDQVLLKSYYKKDAIEAGCDEAGRGCLAGPVFAAAVILPSNFTHSMLTDSKQLSNDKRLALRKTIEQEAIAIGVAMCDVEVIDAVNILNASMKAMHQAIKKLPVKPDYLIIDGNRFLPYPGIGHTCVVKGDSKFFSIAAASILAKTYRDEYMRDLHNQFPYYNWDKNKGYPTRQHRLAIRNYGITPFHRKSFRLLPKQLSLF